MFYQYNESNSINIPEPFKRIITPIFMKDNEKNESCAFSVHTTEWAKGGKVDTHAHEDCTEAMYCMTGKGRCMVDGKYYDFTPGSLIVALPHVSHEIENTGDEMLRVLCIFSPPMTGENLRKRAMDAIDQK